jgi:DNA-binding response OmpR family regulator
LTDPNARPNISHELRTPLNHVIGYSELLMDDAQDSGWDDAMGQLKLVLAAGRELLNKLNGAFADRQVPAQDVLRAAKAGLSQSALEIARHTSGLRDHLPRESWPDVDRIESAVATFQSMLDKFSVGATNPPTQPATDAPSSQQTNTTKPGVILIIDDMPENREVLTQLLTRLGHTVQTAADGRDALTKIETAPIELILLDLMMPIMDGKAFLRQIKANPAYDQVPIIVLSAVDEVRTVTEAIEIGADDYLIKPYDVTLLKTRINAGLERGRQRVADQRYHQHVALLTYAAKALEQDIFEPDLLVPVMERDDALGTLARVFARMAHEIYQREAKLRGQSAALAIEINDDLRQRQVASITSSEFFQTLRARTSRLNS